MREEWRDIDGFKGLYQISNLGQVKSLPRHRQNHSKLQKIEEKILKLTPTKQGYLQVILCKNGKVFSKRVHRLVAEAFIPNPDNKATVNHKNGDKTKNIVDIDNIYGESTNLEWSTYSENLKHAFQTGLNKSPATNKFGKNNWLSKSVEQYTIDGLFVKKWDSIADVERDLNIQHNAISACCRCKRSTAGGYKWRYAGARKTIFVSSDEHGDYNAIKNEERKVGYDETNPNHLRVSLGDCFDRCDDAVAIYEYYKRLYDEGKMIITFSNHFKFLVDFLEGSPNPWNYLHNGLDTTIADFWHRTKPFESWCLIDKQCDMTQESYAEWAKICRDDINNEYPELLPWLKSLPRFFESENYIGVHGAIDTKVDDWHKPHCYRYNLRDWDALDFDDGSFFGSEIKNTDKTVIIGHFGTAHLRSMYDIEGEDPHSILKRDDGRIIAIDATTKLTKRVNVLVIEDNLMEE